MRRRTKKLPAVARLALVTLLASLVAPAPSPAQEMASGDRILVAVQTFEVAPADAGAWEDAARKFVEAATRAEMPSKWRWAVYQEDYTYHVVEWPENMAQYDDPGAWDRAIEGTPGQAPLAEAYRMVGDLDMSHSAVVDEHVAELSYEPATPMAFADHGGAWMAISRIPFGRQEELDANTRRIMTVLETIGYPYPAMVHRNVMGAGGRTTVVVPFDDPGSFWGSNSLEAHLARAGRVAEWREIMTERQGIISSMESTMVTFRPDLSYMPGEGT